MIYFYSQLFQIGILVILIYFSQSFQYLKPTLSKLGNILIRNNRLDENSYVRYVRSRKASEESYSSLQRKEIQKEKLARILSDELSDIISSGHFCKDLFPEELLQQVTVLDIEISNDLGQAKVFLGIDGAQSERSRIFIYLTKHLYSIRHLLRQSLRSFKRIPTIFLKLIDDQDNNLLSDVFDQLDHEEELREQKEKEKKTKFQKLEELEFEEIQE